MLADIAGTVARVRAHAQRAYTRARALGARAHAATRIFAGAHVHFSGKYQGETWEWFFLPGGRVSRGMYVLCECGHETSWAFITPLSKPDNIENTLYESPARLLPFPPMAPPPPEVLPWQVTQ